MVVVLFYELCILGRSERMSELSCSWSMITEAQRTGSSSCVARREVEICSWVNIGRRLLGFTEA